jgi:hypothetical protein
VRVGGKKSLGQAEFVECCWPSLRDQRRVLALRPSDEAHASERARAKRRPTSTCIKGRRCQRTSRVPKRQQAFPQIMLLVPGLVGELVDE